MSRFSKKTNRRYKKVITRRKKNRFTRKYKGKSRKGIKYGGIKYGGAAAASDSSAKLPMIIDQNQVTYTCTPVPTS
jgi:hypothetical protein